MALNFPPSDASPWTAPNGVVYTWNTDGYWEAKADPADLDGEYLKLDASNDPVTGTCEFSDGVSVTGGSAAGVDIGMYADTVNNRLHFTSNSHEGMSLFPDGRFIIRPNNAGNALDISGNIAAGGASNTYVIHSRPTITGTSTSTLFGLVYTTTNDGDLANVNHFYAASATGSGSISGVENIYLAASGSQQGSSVRGFLSNINAVNGKDNYNFYANGDAPNYFAGLTEHEGGVSLTGGSFRETYDQTTGNAHFIYFTPVATRTAGSNSLYNRLTHNDDSRKTFAESAINLYVSHFDNSKDWNFSNDCTISLNRARVGGTIDVTVDSDKTVDIIGFDSYIENNSNASVNTYNFFARGNAPNYFAGTIRTGAITATGSNTGDDSNHTWTEQSRDSNAVRWSTAAGFISRYGVTANDSCFHLNRLGSDTGSFIQFRENGVEIDSITLDGAGGITYGTSDYRLKENIVDLPSATNAIKALRPVNFNFKTHPGKTRPGFIAHEVSETLPVAVTGEKDATEAIGTLTDYNGTVLKTEVTEPSAEDLTYTEEVEATPYVAAVAATYDEYGTELTAEVPEAEATYTTVTRTRTWTPSGNRPVYQGVDQTKLIPLLTKALQEALDKIETLETRLSDAGIA